LLAQEINTALEPLRERRSDLATKPDYIKEILTEGARRAQAIARETLREAKEKMRLI